MAYRVELPPDIEKKAENRSGLSLPKITGESGNTGNDRGATLPLLTSLTTPGRERETAIGPTEGRIVAVLIDSPVVGPVWFALDDGFKSGDDIPVFNASELAHLRGMSPEELRRRYEQKLALGGGWIRDRVEEPTKH